MRNSYGNKPKARRSKYGAKPTGGHASKKEHRRASELRVWERAGLISNLREQVSYTLIPAQYADSGKDLKGRAVRVCLERAVKYVADFVYEMDGQTIVEDTKGYKTPEYKIKRKLMLLFFGIRIKET